jgi:hypothetical protein
MTTLREAAQTLVSTWDATGWQDMQPPIDALRAALAAPPSDMAEIERLLDELEDVLSEHAAAWEHGKASKAHATANMAARAALLTAIADAIAQARREGEWQEWVVLLLRDCDRIIRAMDDDTQETSIILQRLDTAIRTLGAAP